MALNTETLPNFSAAGNFRAPITPMAPPPKPVLSPEEEAARKAKLNAESVAGLKNEAGIFAAPNIGATGNIRLGGAQGGGGVFATSNLPTLAPVPTPQAAPTPAAIPEPQAPVQATQAAAPAVSRFHMPALTPTYQEDIARGMSQQEAYRQKGFADAETAAKQGNPDNYSYRLAHYLGALGENKASSEQESGGTAALNAQKSLAQQSMVESEENARKAAELGNQQDIEAQKLHAEKAKQEQERWQFLPNIGVGGLPESPTHAMEIRTGTVKELGGSAPVEGTTSTSGGKKIVYKSGQWVAA